ncbi:hypothetical protein O988_09800, partial [Pseudogymnoascus sp. VKM F-3808]
MASIARVLRPAAARAALAARPTVRTPGAIRIAQATRTLSTTQPRRNDTVDITDIPPTPITHLSDIESSMQEAVSKFAVDVIGP